MPEKAFTNEQRAAMRQAMRVRWHDRHIDCALSQLDAFRERVLFIARSTAEMKRHLATDFNNRQGSMSQRIMWQGMADVCKAQAALLDEFAAEVQALPLVSNPASAGDDQEV